MAIRKRSFTLGGLTGCMVVLSMMANTVNAQDPARISAGPFDITPSIDINYEDNDNFFQAVNDPTEVTTTVVAPGLLLVTDNGVASFDLSFRLEDGQRSGVSDEFDYTDQRFGAGVDWKANVRNQFTLDWSLFDGHNNPTADNAGQQVEYEDTELSFRYTYGADGARGRIILGLTGSDLEYTNNRLDPLNPTAELDSQTSNIDLSFRALVGGSSSIVLQLIDNTVEFENDRDRDRNDLTYLLGFVWGGLNDSVESQILLGQTENELTEQNVQSTESTWRVNLSLTPRDYTSFSLEASQNTQSGEDGVGDFNIVNTWVASWVYDWNPSLRSTLSFSTSSEDIRQADGSFRVDDIDEISLGLAYNIRRWLSANLTYTTAERSSDDSSIDYEQDTVQLSLVMSL